MVLGVDVGGSKVKFVLWDGKRVLRRGSLRWRFGGRWEDLKEEVENLRGRMDFDKMGFAVKGVWTKREKESLGRVLGGVVISDVEGVLFDAFGEGDGMVLIAGTGSICVARKGGKIFRYGGYGYIFSDWGSGFWIGKMAVELALKKESFLRIAIFGTEDMEEIRGKIKRIMGMDKEKMVRKIAEFSKVVFEVAKMGDEDANYILESAIRELLVMCLKVYRVSEVQEIALHGGLFRDPYFRERFISLLKRYSMNVVGYNFDGARGVAKFTMASGGLR
ncbi:hypothetical protein LM594_05260 [Candidatus Caldipriscus sp.]|nr:hypothetical protein [Candidatus Caldipriscus sp.]